jgi:hypothetical protein
MFGTHPIGVKMDSVVLASAFKNAFDTHVVSFHLSVDNTHQSQMINGYFVSSYTWTPVYTLQVSVVMQSLPVNKSLMGYFEIVDPETRLVEIKTTTHVEPNTGGVHHAVDLTYKMLSYDKFICALNNLVYNRFSEEFHKQLEDKLD